MWERRTLCRASGGRRQALTRLPTWLVHKAPFAELGRLHARVYPHSRKRDDRVPRQVGCRVRTARVDCPQGIQELCDGYRGLVIEIPARLESGRALSRLGCDALELRRT